MIKLDEVVQKVEAQFYDKNITEALKSYFHVDNKPIIEFVSEEFSVSDDNARALSNVAFGVFSKQHYIDRESSAKQRLQYADSYQAGEWDRSDIALYSGINHFLKNNVE